MGKASERRFKKEAKRLAKLVEEDANLFFKVWENRVSGWLAEMHSISARLRHENAKVTVKNFGEEKSETQTIGSIWERADALIKACGEKVEALVGVRTRNLLDAECAKLIAQVYNPQLYRMLAHRQYTIKGKNVDGNRVLIGKQCI